MTIRIDDASRDAALDAVNGQIDAGTGTAKLQLYTGTPPTSVDDPPGETLLVEFDLPDPAFGASANGAATANEISEDEGLAEGTVGWGRVTNQDGTAVSDNDNVSDDGSGQLDLNTLSVSEGALVSVESWTRTMPAQ